MVLLASPLRCSAPLGGVAPLPATTAAEQLPELSAPNPLPITTNVQLEELTWMEVRDKVRDGYRRVIVPTGGIEQNGPFVGLNKHDLIVKEVARRAANLAPGTLVAPVVSFVPEGNISPPSGHMRYPGTISVTEETFVKLLSDITISLAVHGFTEIVLIGDSGDSQAGLAKAAAKLRALSSVGAAVRFEGGFYNYDGVRTLLKERGISEQPEPFHEELAFSLQLLAIQPSAIRYEERIKAGRSSLGGISLLSREQLMTLGEDILNYRAKALSDLIQQRSSS